MTDEAAAFPPATIEAFLRFCAGEWMGLRSRFALDTALEDENGDAWHSSERGIDSGTATSATPEYP